MNKKSLSIVFGLLVIVFAVLLFGCGSSPNSAKAAKLPLYDNVLIMWNSEYTSDITADAVNNQISRMEEEKANSNPGVTSVLGLPPGFYAHLGMLYTLAGNRTTAANYYEMEKTCFPESASFMEFLVNRNRRVPTISGEISPPCSILILPVTNVSTNVDAPTNVFLNRATSPFISAGYYVLPVSITSQVFAQNGVTIADEAHNLPPARLRQIFGADAALYVSVAKCGIFLDTAMVVAACKLVDLRTGEDLWINTGSAEETIARNRRNRGFLGDVTAAFLGDTAGNIVGTVNAARTVDYNALGIKAAGSLFYLSGRNNRLPPGPYLIKAIEL